MGLGAPDFIQPEHVAVDPVSQTNRKGDDAAELPSVDVETGGLPCAGPSEADTRELGRSLLTMCTLSIVQALGLSMAVVIGIISVDWRQFGSCSLLLVVLELTRRSLFACLRSVFLRLVVGLPAERIRDIEGTRMNLPADWLSELLASPRTKRRIKVCDVLFRKGAHVFTAGLLLVLNGWMFTDEGAIVLSLSLCIVTVVNVQAALVWVCSRPSASRVWRVIYYLLFGAMDRIRDGRYGQRNAMAGAVSMMYGVIGAYVVMLIGGLPEDEEVPGLLDLSAQMVLLPLTYGDAMGEIIGTPLGGRYFWKFAVRGFGEINQKSIEGCVAVFLGSLVASLIAIGTLTQSVTPATWALPVALAALTTLTETFSFRSTDNFVIPLCNAAFLVCWWHLSHAGGIMAGESACES
jgi:dolichol kinase